MNEIDKILLKIFLFFYILGFIVFIVVKNFENKKEKSEFLLTTYRGKVIGFYIDNNNHGMGYIYLKSGSDTVLISMSDFSEQIRIVKVDDSIIKEKNKIYLEIKQKNKLITRVSYKNSSISIGFILANVIFVLFLLMKLLFNLPQKGILNKNNIEH